MGKNTDNGSEISIRDLKPIWFGLVISLVFIALSTKLLIDAYGYGGLAIISEVLVYLSLLLVVTLGALWAIKAALYRQDMWGELKGPAGGKNALLPGATASVALALTMLGEELNVWEYQSIAVILWALSAALVFVFIVILAYSAMNCKKECISAGSPAIAAILTAFAGLAVIPLVSEPLTQEMVLWEAYFDLAIGIALLAVMGIAAVSKGPGAIPKDKQELWLTIAPLALLAMVLPILFTETGARLFPGEENMNSAIFGIIPLVLSPLLIGLAVWIAIILALLTLKGLKKPSLCGENGWWQMVFPVGALSTASFMYPVLYGGGEAFEAFNYIGLATYILMWIFVAIVAYNLLKPYMKDL